MVKEQEKYFVEIECDKPQGITRYKLNLYPVEGRGENPKYVEISVTIKEIESHFLLRERISGIVGIEHDKETAEKRAYDLVKERADFYVEKNGRTLVDSTKYSKKKLEAKVI